jgi:hypothetical protein
MACRADAGVSDGKHRRGDGSQGERVERITCQMLAFLVRFVNPKPGGSIGEPGVLNARGSIGEPGVLNAPPQPQRGRRVVC